MAMTYNIKQDVVHILHRQTVNDVLFLYPFAKLFIQFPAFSFYSYFIDFAGVI